MRQHAEPYSPDEIRQIIAKISMQDPDALMKIYDQFWPSVFGVAFYLSGDTELAEDVAQDVFLKLWRTPEAFDPERGELQAWLAVSARNRTIDTFRRRRHEESSSDLVFIDERPATSDAQLDFEKVRALLGRLPENQQSVFQLSFFEHLSHQQIADRLHEPLGTVKSRLRLGLQTLRRFLNLARKSDADNRRSQGSDRDKGISA